MKRKIKRVRHWAVMGKSGNVLRDLSGHLSIWTWRKGAEVDCPVYGHVAQVEVREIKRKP